MKLFNKNRNTNVPEDLEAYTAGHRDWRGWVRNAVVALVLVLLVAGVVWAGVQVYQNVTDDDTTNQPADQKNKEGEKPAATESPKKSDAAKNSGSAATDSSQNATPQPTTIPKTGDDTVTPQPATLPSTGG